MGTKPEISQRYPRKIELDESLGSPGPSFMRVRPGGQRQVRPVSLRLMGAADKHSILLLARSLPQEHLLFLHADITEPASVDEWINSIERGATVTLLAEPDGTLEGYASLHLNSVQWTRKVAQIAINVAPEWQSRGLGEGLCAEMMTLAGILELRKIAAQMVADHKSARAMFERLGFRLQAFLPDWVEDREGRCRDLLVMTYDVRAPGRKGPASA
ncbi:MAG: GNAT family N-acetyltransferase [Candidatus Binataceae bacterium]